MTRPRILAFAQLLRLPNVFTAFADICMAAAVVGVITNRPLAFLGILCASGLLYLSGMAWNDYFDRVEDARMRPFRPIPSGRVSAGTARWLALILMLLGVAIAAAVGFAEPEKVNGIWHPGIVAVVLAAAILLYDGFFKQNFLGSLAMGFCRFLNVLLGLTLADAEALPELQRFHLASIIGLYIVGVTWFARTEESTSRKSHLLAASSVMGLSLLLALALPLHREAGNTTFFFPYFLVLFGFYLGLPIQRAIFQPTPQRVQIAVKTCILGLVILDAIIAVAFVGLPGLLIVLLLVPAILIGKKIYST